MSIDFGQVETVRGAVEVRELGPTLMHEHVFVLAPEALQNYGCLWGDSYWDEEVRVADAIGKLRALRLRGIQTIVDPAVPGLGRFLPRIQRVNAEVDLHIIVATGVYTFFELPMFLRSRTDDAIAEIFIREIREGINDTGVRAGFLKCAVDAPGVAGDVGRVLSAVASASLDTGAPVMVHTNAAARTGLSALAALTERGVDPTRIVIAHAGDSDDLEYLRALADSGASLGFDRFGLDFYAPDARRIATLLILISEGYGDRVHLAHDASCFFDPAVANPAFADEKLDYLHISNEILPALTAAGLTQEQIEELLVANPQRYFQTRPGAVDTASADGREAIRPATAGA
jgi:phosphotriesterase-related protein